MTATTALEGIFEPVKIGGFFGVFRTIVPPSSRNWKVPQLLFEVFPDSSKLPLRW